MHILKLFWNIKVAQCIQGEPSIHYFKWIPIHKNQNVMQDMMFGDQTSNDSESYFFGVAAKGPLVLVDFF